MCLAVQPMTVEIDLRNLLSFVTKPLTGVLSDQVAMQACGPRPKEFVIRDEALQHVLLFVACKPPST